MRGKQRIVSHLVVIDAVHFYYLGLSDIQLHLVDADLLQYRVYGRVQFVVEEATHLRDASSSEVERVRAQSHHLLPAGVEEGITEELANVDRIAVISLLNGLQCRHSYLGMSLLSPHSPPGQDDKRLLQCEQRQRPESVAAWDVESLENVLHRGEYRVSSEEGFAQNHSSVGRVVESALQSLVGQSTQCLLDCLEALELMTSAASHVPPMTNLNQVSRKSADSLAAHRVALVGHCRASHLIGPKWLRQLVHSLQQAYVTADLLRDGSQFREREQQISILLARVSLPCDIEATRAESRLLRHELVQFLHCVLVAVKEGEEGVLVVDKLVRMSTTLDLLHTCVPVAPLMPRNRIWSLKDVS